MRVLKIAWYEFFLLVCKTHMKQRSLNVLNKAKTHKNKSIGTALSSWIKNSYLIFHRDT